MKGDEVIASGDILVTDNRIAAVGRTRHADGAGRRARRSTSRGKTIMPGLVDAHSHMWAPRGLHQTEVWQYLANLAYGVTTTRDPQTSTPDVFAYADMVDAGMMPGPRVYATGPGRVLRHRASRIARRRSASSSATRTPTAPTPSSSTWPATASCASGSSRRARSTASPPTIEGSLDLKLNLTQMADGYSGQEHSFPIMPLYKDVVEFVARTKTFYTPTILVAYGAPWSENYWFETENTGRRREAAQVDPVGAARHMIRRRPQWFLPEEYGHTQDRQAGGRHRARRRTRRPRQPRPAAGPGRALGDVEPRLGRPDAARDAAGRHALRRRGDRPAAGRRLARSRQARRPAGARHAIRSRTSATPTRSAT